MSNPEYSFQSPRNQLFAFPQDVISSMLENPSSHKGLLKLYQTCKYFYGKRPILIADDVGFGIEEDQPEDEAAIVAFLFNGIYKNVSHLQTPIWLTGTVTFGSDQQLPKIYRSSAHTIFLEEYCVDFKDFLLLTSEKTVKNFNSCWPSHICHPNGPKATIYEVLQHLPNIRYFSYFIDEKCSAEMLKMMNELKLNDKLQMLTLAIFDVHETFDLNLFCEFIQNWTEDDTTIAFMINPAIKEKLKLALEKMNPKWKETADVALQGLFEAISHLIK